MATLTNMITRVADDAGSSASVTGVSARITRFLNRVCQKQWMTFPWPFRWRTYRIILLPEITDTSSTFTASATNGSRTVNFSGNIGITSNVYTGHLGWYMVFPGDAIQNFYKVLAVNSTTQLVLDQPYQGTTGSGYSFKLRKLDYILPSEVSDIETMIFTYDNHVIPMVDPSSLEVLEPQPLGKGTPVGYHVYSSFLKQNSYSTGTLSGTINTYTVTGVGTSWLANAFPGDILTIGANVYTVNSVDSDTQITLYQQQQVTSAASTAYTLTNQYQRIARIIFSADQNYTVDIRYLRNYWNLVNNNDLNELTYFYEDAVVKAAAALELKQKGDQRAGAYAQEAEAIWSEHKASVDAENASQNVKSLFSPYRARLYSRLR